MKSHPILIYSPFGTGKTSLIGLLIRALGLKARIVTAEHTNSIQDVIDDGLAEVWKVNTRDHPFETMDFAADAFWPTDLENPKAPLALEPPAPIRVFEGLATISNYISGSYAIGGMAQRIGAGEQIGPTDSGELVRVQDGSVSIGGLSRSNYGFVQKQMTSLVQRTQRLPGYVIWTAHEDDVKEKKAGVATGNTIIGPEVFGGALTQVIGREFSDVWRLVSVPIDYQNSDGTIRRVLERRLYLKNHVCPVFGLPALARNSGGLPNQGKLPDYIRLTEPDRPGEPRMDAATILIDLLKL